MRVAVVGGGINGIMSAAAIRSYGHEVVVLERFGLVSQTSSVSTKLLHGGLRYLEQGSFGLVREALTERAWWLREAPELCQPIRLVLPVWSGKGRSPWILRAGLWLYDRLAGKAAIAPHQWLDRDATIAASPGLHPEGLRGSFAFWDGQMDDRLLGLWAADRARGMGVHFREYSRVDRIAEDGTVWMDGGSERFDCVVNVAGPWAAALLTNSGIKSRNSLDLIRGSHLVISRPCPSAILAQVNNERRIAFILPWKGGTLLGTTEVRQQLNAPIECSVDERAYLYRFHDQLMAESLRDDEVVQTFAGLRPLIRSAVDPTRASREYEIERHGRIVTVFGGKWTTARALGVRVAVEVSKTA